MFRTGNISPFEAKLCPNPHPLVWLIRIDRFPNCKVMYGGNTTTFSRPSRQMGLPGGTNTQRVIQYLIVTLMGLTFHLEVCVYPGLAVVAEQFLSRTRKLISRTNYTYFAFCLG